MPDIHEAAGGVNKRKLHPWDGRYGAFLWLSWLWLRRAQLEGRIGKFMTAEVLEGWEQVHKSNWNWVSEDSQESWRNDEVSLISGCINPLSVLNFRTRKSPRKSKIYSVEHEWHSQRAWSTTLHFFTCCKWRWIARSASKTVCLSIVPPHPSTSNLRKIIFKHFSRYVVASIADTQQKGQSRSQTLPFCRIAKLFFPWSITKLRVKKNEAKSHKSW